MDSPGGSSVSSLGASEATKLLKEMLNMGGLGNPGLGKSRSESSDTSTASLASHVRAALENSDSLQGVDKADNDRESRHENGNTSFEEMSLPGAEPVSDKQTVRLQGTDTNNSFVITGKHVEIIESEASGSSQATSGSNKVKINPVVKFEWEHRYYTGNMVAVHTDCVHVAYVLKGKSGGIVRIINRKTAQRTLLKGFTGRVQDIAFARLSTLILGCVDEAGDMFVHEIQESPDSNISTTLLLNVTRTKGSPVCTNHRLIWCPYIGDADDSSAANTTNTTDSLSMCDYNKMLVLTHDNTVEIWNIDMVTKEHGSGPMLSTDVQTGLLTIDQEGHKAPITSAAFSPDGTAIATAGLDGQVKFFQVYFSDNTPPRCLHQWTPHNGRPLSSLFFLDDHKHPNPNATFWKFAVTGADSNREIKVWGCESWVCLQQINIVSPPDDLPSNFHMEPCLKACLDLSANYLVLSDIKRKVLLVFELSQDEKSACMSAVSEFLLTQPCLSFSILDAGRRRTHKAADEEDDPIADMTTGEVDIDEEEEVSRDAVGPDIEVAMNMYSVHTKAFQHLQIRYKVDWTSSRPPPLSTSFVSQETTGFMDPLSDMSIETVASERDGAMSLTQGVHASGMPEGLEQPLVALPEPTAPLAPLLMTPDAFSSPSPKKPESLVYVPDAVAQSSMSTLSSLTHVTTMDDDHPQTVSTGQDSATSSVTITPASSLDLTAGLPLNTPTSVPLPPPTPGEDSSNASSRRMSEVEAASPSSFRSQPPEFIKDTLSHLPSPPHSEGSFPTMPALNKDFFTSSPMQQTEHRFKPALTSSGQSGDAVDKMFSGDTSSVHHQRVKLQSNGSSSSTSLEVSEILDGMKKSDPEEFLGEEEEEEEEAEDAQVKQEQMTEHAQGEVVALPAKPHYDLKAWPKPPDVADVNRDAERLTVDALMNAGLPPLQQGELAGTSPPVQQQDDDVQIEEDEDDESEPTEVLNRNKDDQSTSHGQATQRNDPAQLTPADSSLTHELQTCVRQMLELLQTQHREIINLRRDLTEQQQLSSAVSDLQSDVRTLETNLSSQVAGALREHAQAESHRLQKVLETCDSQQRQKQDRLVSSVTAALDRSVGSRLEQLVKAEFSRTVVPNVTRVLEPIKEQLHTDMAQRLTATDTLMKENISKLVRSRQTMEVLAQAASGAITMPVQAACRDVLVPGFDRACQSIFHQVNQTFQRGTQEYMQGLERHLEHVRRQHAESRDPVVQQLQSMVAAFEGREEAYKPLCAQLQQVSETMRSSAQQIQASNSRLETSVQEAMKRMQDNLSSQLRTIIQTELTTALHDQKTSLGDHLINAMRSGAVTPIVSSVSPDPQQIQGHVLQLLRQGQLNSAFQQALSASDLGLVIYVCETVNPSQVFNQTPCPLQQPVLLSLIQQLSADLTANMELKYKYLEEAIMNLDTANPVTKEHMPAVLGHLCQNLTAYIHANPNDQMTRNMRILQMAAQSLLK